MLFPLILAIASLGLDHLGATATTADGTTAAATLYHKVAVDGRADVVDHGCNV
eukprot:SAG11_NODE_1288_length_5297_cov_13.005194_5_plen_53_part_00